MDRERKQLHADLQEARTAAVAASSAATADTAAEEAAATDNNAAAEEAAATASRVEEETAAVVAAEEAAANSMQIDHLQLYLTTERAATAALIEATAANTTVFVPGKVMPMMM
jgi:hypothetical protein